MNPTSNESQLFLRDKQAWENAIANYSGTDPLELWYNYICWFDYNVHIDPENKFRETLEKCLAIFEHNECYKQDIRMIKLWVKYIDLQPNPLKLYQILYQRGIGTQCSYFFIGWAHYYDSANALREAESVYNLGFQAHAEPYSELQEAHTKFRLSVSQRMLYNDSSSKKRSANHLNEQRQQITTLNPPAKKVRTDPAEFADHFQHQTNSQLQQTNNVQHTAQVHSTTNSTQNLPNFQSEKSNGHHASTHLSESTQIISNGITQFPTSQSHEASHVESPSTVQATNFKQVSTGVHNSDHSENSSYLQSSNRFHVQQHQTSTQNANSCSAPSSDQCNLNNSAHVISSSLNYIYGQDSTPAQVESNQVVYPLQNVKLPSNFAKICKNNYETWKPILFLEEPFDLNRRCIYQKHVVYPGDGEEHSPEEIRARNYTKKHDELVKRKDKGQTKVNSPAETTVAPVTYRTEDQIEASTIRFSTDADGCKKNKRITIKFRREPAAQASSHNVNGHGTGETASTYSYSIEEGRKSCSDDVLGGKAANYTGSPRQTPKIKKVKKIRIVNNYDDPRYTANSNSSSSPYYCNQTYQIKNTTTISRNEYEDANLLLSFANVSSDSNAYKNYSSTQNGDTVCNDDQSSNLDMNSSFNENSYIDLTSNCSTPVRKLSQSYSKTSTPQYLRTLKRHTSNISAQNDDSMCSYEQNSFFAAEQDEDLKLRRLEKAQNTIETHLARSVIDPFSSELCKAFLTKLDFPSRDENDVYKLINAPIPKLANTRSVTLADVSYSIEKEVGRGSYGSVYKAVNNMTGAVVALKFQKPPNSWELYICTEVRKRTKNYDILPGFMDISSAIIAPNASILITEFSVYGSLLDINNKIRQATKKVMHESLVMHFSSQILSIVSHLHSCKIIHADIKPDNFLLMRVPSSDSHIPSLRLIDFGCAIDMSLFPERTQFIKVVQTDGFTCIEMQEGRPWTYQTDLFCIAGTVHVMLFGEYMQLVKKFDVWDIKQKLPRYLKKQVWSEFFTKMLNIKDMDNLPDLIELKNLLDVNKMDSELQTQIRTLSNLLHRR